MKRGARLLLKSGVAFLDQAILSGTNFAITIVLMKTVAKEEYGYYSIAFAVSLFFVSLQNAIVTTPLAVLLAGKRREEKDEYVGALYWGQVIAAIPAAAIGISASAVTYWAGVKSIQVLTIGSLCFAAVGILQREFLRAYYYARQLPLTVLRLDSFYAVAVLSFIAFSHWAFEITAPLAFVLMGVSALITSAMFTQRNWKFRWSAIRETYREHWPFAKWSLGGVAVTHIQSYCSLYLTGALLGSSSAGTFAASRLPLTPMALLQTGWNKVAIPRGAHLRELRKLRQFLKEQLLVTAIVAITVAAYVAVLLMASDFLKSVLFGQRYENVLDFIGFWAAINIAVFAGLTASAGLQVMKEFGAITKINCVTMIITLACNAIFISRFGIKGGLISSLLGESLLSMSLWWCLTRKYFREYRVVGQHHPALVIDASPHRAHPAGWHSSSADEGNRNVCSVCIATYKRPQLLDRLLTSLERQIVPDHIRLQIIVVDNDADESARPVVRKHRDSKHIAFQYFVQPVKNISLTRNTAVANARGAYVLFIDDDEVATPTWAGALLQAALDYQADAVFGPVIPMFDKEAPEWIRKSGRFLVGTIPETATGTEAVATWTGNCLVKTSTLRSIEGPFNPEYGNTGGEDTELFNRLKRNGARLISCNEALVFEYWPLSRTRLPYLLRKGLRGGNTHTRRAIAFAERKWPVRVFMLIKAIAFGCLSLLISILALPSRMWRTYWQMKVASNVGRFMAVVGQHYRSYN